MVPSFLRFLQGGTRAAIVYIRFSLPGTQSYYTTRIPTRLQKNRRVHSKYCDFCPTDEKNKKQPGGLLFIYGILVIGS